MARVSSGQDVIVATFGTKSERSVPLGEGHYDCCPFCLCRLDDSLGERLVYFGHPEYLGLGFVRYGAECTSAVFGQKSWMRCFAMSKFSKWPSHMDQNSVFILVNGFRPDYYVA